jgi:hypothetical protein
VKEKLIPIRTAATGTIIQSITDQHNEKAGNQETTKDSDIVHCTHTAESANVNIHNIFRV